MRFEIGPGGGFVILVGLLGLSAGVFFLGMVSGREMAQSEVSQTQLATAFPMPAVPAAVPSPAAAAAATPSAPAPVAPARAALTSTGTAPKSAPGRAAATEHNSPPRRVAVSTPPHLGVPSRTAEASSPATASTQANGSNENRASTPPPEEHRRSYSAAHRRGYNIVIDAAMDRAGANRMVSRLLALGYTPRIVPSPMNGQMWYKVQVGPYPTEDDARAAQAQLRAAYTARYVNRSGSASGGAGSADSTR